MGEDASAGAKRSPPGDDKSSVRASDQSELVDEMRDRVAYLERQVEEEREARRRADAILAQLSRANAEQARTIRALEGPAAEPPASEPPGAPETGADVKDKGDVPGDHSEAQQAQEERLAWHKKWEHRLLLVLGAIVGVSALLLLAVAVLPP